MFEVPERIAVISHDALTLARLIEAGVIESSDEDEVEFCNEVLPHAQKLLQRCAVLGIDYIQRNL
jgi:hypothetical protein